MRPRAAASRAERRNKERESHTIPKTTNALYGVQMRPSGDHSRWQWFAFNPAAKDAPFVAIPRRDVERPVDERQAAKLRDYCAEWAAGNGHAYYFRVAVLHQPRGNGPALLSWHLSRAFMGDEE
jgi:hypothetical protein